MNASPALPDDIQDKVVEGYKVAKVRVRDAMVAGKSAVAFITTDDLDNDDGEFMHMLVANRFMTYGYKVTTWGNTYTVSGWDKVPVAMS